MTTSRADLHCHSTASEVSKLGVQRALGLPECATPPEEVYCAGQAPRDGLRDDHRPRHDRRRPGDRGPAGRVHLRGADGPLPRRAAGRARAVLRDHARRSRVAAGARGRRRGRRRLPARRTRSPARWRTRSTRSRRRCSRATGAGSRSSSTSGRSATARARRSSTTRPRSTSRRTAASASAGSDDHAGVDIGRTWSRDAVRARPGRVPRARPRRPRRGARRSGLGGQVGARGDGAGRPRARPRRLDGRAGPERGPADGRARDDGGRCPQRPHGRRSLSRGRPGPAARVARRGRPAPERT